MINYSHDFKSKLKLIFPKNHKIHGLVEANSYLVGEILDGQLQTTIHYRDILSAKTLEEIQFKAQILKDKYDLFKQWEIEVNHWNQSLARP